LKKLDEEKQRGAWGGIYRLGHVVKRAGNQSELKGGVIGGNSVSDEKFRWGRKTMMWPSQVGPARQQGREKNTYRFRIGFLGRGPDLELGQIVSLGPFFMFFLLFFLFFFCFLISFITFANLVQIDSIQFVNFSKIQLNILRQ
jgi:hypothetical protein